MEFQVPSPFAKDTEKQLENLSSKYVRVSSFGELKRNGIIKISSSRCTIYRIVRGRKVNGEGGLIYLDYDTFEALQFNKNEDYVVRVRKANRLEQFFIAPFHLFEAHEKPQYVLVLVLTILSLVFGLF